MKLENHEAVIGLLDIRRRLTLIRKSCRYLWAHEKNNQKVEYFVGGQKASHAQGPSIHDIHCLQLQEEIDAYISENLNIGLDMAINRIDEKLQFLGVEL